MFVVVVVFVRGGDVVFVSFARGRRALFQYHCWLVVVWVVVVRSAGMSAQKSIPVVSSLGNQQETVSIIVEGAMTSKCSCEILVTLQLYT